MQRLSILLLCQAERSEFEQAGATVRVWGDVVTFSDVSSAAASLSLGETSPDLIVVAQAFPGQFSHEAVDRLRRLAPLARIVGLLGSWCEGEMRTGSPWPGVVRAYWHQAAARCRREFQRLTEGRRCSWILPPTATEEERLLAMVADDLPRQQGLAVIHATSREMAGWLMAVCRSAGYAVVWRRYRTETEIAGAAVALFDATDLSPDECNDLRELAATVRPAPVIALLGFPRCNDHRRAEQAGAAAVLSKPLLLDDLLWTIKTTASMDPASVRTA